MADNATQNMPNPSASKAESILDTFKDEFLPRHGTKLLVALLMIVGGFFGYQQYQKSVASREAAAAETVGKGFDHLYNGRADSARIVLESAISSGSLSPLSLAKAALLVGNLHLQNGDLDGAASFYQKAMDNAKGSVLIESGARHGLATAAIEKKDYQKAASLLEAFVSSYGKRTGDLAARYAKTEPVDEITTVPDALWKLSLCYAELKQNDKAKATAEKLVRIYGESRQALQARKFLATL